MKYISIVLVIIFLPVSLRAELLRIAATTSLDNSGLTKILLPRAEKALNCTIHLIVVGTGKALRLAKAGDLDAVIVHSRAAEDAFIAAGHGAYRREIMYNDFILVGPKNDPAGVRQALHISKAFEKIANIEALFISRGDDSGTHKREIFLWGKIQKKGLWYREIGAGMGAVLNMAAATDAYSLSDRASWLNFKNKQNLALLYEGDSELFNQYAYLPVSVKRHPHVNAELAQKFEKWLTSDEAKNIINTYKIDGQRMFFFNAVSHP